MANQKQWIHERSGGVALLIIDPQVDFHPGGSLAIATANDDSQRIADLIRANITSITQIVVTLDTHQPLHISNPGFWTSAAGADGAAGAPPAPFTEISLADLESGKWTTKRPEHKDWARHYIKSLEEGGRFKHTIWPEHCLIGTDGHAVVPALRDALREVGSSDGVSHTTGAGGGNMSGENIAARPWR